jgi:Predicted dehydrogenases and related proteins
MNRRSFLSTSAAIGALTIVPRSVLGRGFTAPSDKITMLYLGCGYQGFSDLGALIKCPQIEIIGVADPNKQSNDYLGWSANDQRNRIRTLINEPNWFEGVTGHPGGRDVMKYVVDAYYKKNRPGYTGSCLAEEDYREMLAKMSDVDTVKITTPDHLHSYIAADCLKRGKHIISQKPVGNKLHEAMKVIDISKEKPNLATYIMAWGSSSNNGINQTKAWIEAGAIGQLKEIHNWTDRPFWPQYAEIPTERPPIPRGFNWDLWLGPAQMREYSPKYTHCQFRGWFEFGGGSICDMGIYSMMPVFIGLGLGSATSASSRFSRVYGIDVDQVPRKIVNTWSFPLAGGFRFELPYKNEKITFTWHDGGMKPNCPAGYPGDDLPIDGMMFIGEKGIIVGGVNGQNPQLIGLSAADMKRYGKITAPGMENTREEVSPGTPRWLQGWIDRIKGGPVNPGSFDFVRELTETYTLGAVSMMRDGAKLIYDSTARRVTNDEEGNKLLHRDTRKGWEFV